FDGEAVVRAAVSARDESFDDLSGDELDVRDSRKAWRVEEAIVHRPTSPTWLGGAAGAFMRCFVSLLRRRLRVQVRRRKAFHRRPVEAAVAKHFQRIKGVAPTDASLP